MKHSESKRQVPAEPDDPPKSVRLSRWSVFGLPLLVTLLAVLVAFWQQQRPSASILPEQRPINSTGTVVDGNPTTVNNTTIASIPQTSSSNRPEEDCSCSVINNDDSLASTFWGGPSGHHTTVADCCCTFWDLEQANAQVVHPLLQQIVQTPFFSHFPIDLCSSCELWDDAPLCILKDCAVCECEDPPAWAVAPSSESDARDTRQAWMSTTNTNKEDKNGEDCDHVDDQVVVGIVDDHLREDWTSTNGLSFLDKNWDEKGAIREDSSVPSESRSNAVIVDLQLNPERYTGYAGPSAEKVWTAIHEQNCFQSPDPHADDATVADENEMMEGREDAYCALTSEQRVYNRIISGLHSSISLHIAHSYCLEVDPEHPWECQTWGPNVTLAHERVLDHPDRLENLYVAFAMTLRAVQKAGAAVTAAVPSDDAFFSESLAEWTSSLLPELSSLAQTCPMTFDESSLFSEDSSYTHRLLELQKRFRHLQKIMECVGCDRCKLWGTLQTLGVGTALRVLLNDYETEGDVLTLSRQEAVALVHTLERFSSSLAYANELRRDKNVLTSA